MSDNCEDDDVIQKPQIVANHKIESYGQQNNNTSKKNQGENPEMSAFPSQEHNIPKRLKSTKNDETATRNNNRHISLSRLIGTLRSANEGDDDDCSISVKSHKSNANARISTSSLTRKRHEFRDYMTLLKKNRNYRLYLASHLCQHAGDWFVHVASLIAIEQLAPNSGLVDFLSMCILK